MFFVFFFEKFTLVYHSLGGGGRQLFYRVIFKVLHSATLIVINSHKSSPLFESSYLQYCANSLFLVSFPNRNDPMYISSCISSFPLHTVKTHSDFCFSMAFISVFNSFSTCKQSWATLYISLTYSFEIKLQMFSCAKQDLNIHMESNFLQDYNCFSYIC